MDDKAEERETEQNDDDSDDDNDYNDISEGGVETATCRYDSVYKCGETVAHATLSPTVG